MQALASNPLQAAAVGNVNPDSSHVKSQCRTVLATSNAIIQLLNKEEDMMKEAYAQSIECEEPCEGRLSRTVL